ncbi:MAG: polysaccharide deacetylase family protein [Nitrococcus sp.]|nr:polysaccharide deacetylase family protein [Nitrococcus sp.]
MSQRLSILIYHRVLPAPDPLRPDEIHAALFECHMRWLRRVCRVLPLEDAVQRLRSGSLPPRALSLTFDDGYADNVDVALPILRRLDLTATFFIASGFLDGGRMWNDTVIEVLRHWRGNFIGIPGTSLSALPTSTIAERRVAIARALPALKYLAPAQRQAACDELARDAGASLPSLMMSVAQVRELARAGMTIGAHTRTHPILSCISRERAQAEIEGNRAELESLIRKPVRLFAYPNGKPDTDYTTEHVHMLRDLGFCAAVSTAPASATAATDPLQLPRFTPWDRSVGRFLLRLAYVRHTATPAVASQGRTEPEGPAVPAPQTRARGSVK